MSKQSSVVSTGLTAGIAVLALLLAFAVLLPRLTDGDLDLPDSFPGGLLAVDLDATWDSMSDDLKAQFEAAGTTPQAVQQNLEAARATADANVSAATDAKTASRLYVDSQFQNLYAVQAFRTAGGVFAPGILDTSEQVTVVDGVTCIVAQTSSGVSNSDCQISSGTLTVKAQASAEPAMVARVAKAAFESLS